LTMSYRDGDHSRLDRREMSKDFSPDVANIKKDTARTLDVVRERLVSTIQSDKTNKFLP